MCTAQYAIGEVVAGVAEIPESGRSGIYASGREVPTTDTHRLNVGGNLRSGCTISRHKKPRTMAGSGS
jgi:hypothetical protein